MINPKSLANLTPFGTIDRERHREIIRAGGDPLPELSDTTKELIK